MIRKLILKVFFLFLSISISFSNVNDQIDLNFDLLLLSTGRIPNTDNLELKNTKVKTDNFGFIKVDNKYLTNIDNIYAIGDVIGGSMLAHKASEEGSKVIEGIINPDIIKEEFIVPACIYCQPEIAYVGLTEEEFNNISSSMAIPPYKHKFGSNKVYQKVHDFDKWYKEKKNK